MIGKSPSRQEPELFRPMLSNFIDMNHEIVLLADKIDWTYFEKEFAPLYCQTNGAKSKPIRFMVGCLMLKYLYNLGDETFAKRWVENPYMQYFTGEAFFQYKFGCDPSEFVHFRKRIGEKGITKIFQYSIRLHGKDAEEELVLSDTTVQENNTTFPTDAKLYKKVIDGCNRIAKKEKLKQRQTYGKESKNLLRETHNAQHPKRKRKAIAAKKKLQTLAGRQVREIKRLLGEVLGKYADELLIYDKILKQERTSKDKIYSPHKPYTTCIAKGKAGTPYEFGNKVGAVTTAKSRIVIAIRAFEGNPHDSKTIEPLMEDVKNNVTKMPKQCAYDRGGRGPKEVLGVEIITPGKPKASDTVYEKAKKRYPFRRRAGIEPHFGHLKYDYRMLKNYLHGASSSTSNAMMAATAWNLMKMMKKLKRKIIILLENLCQFVQPPQLYLQLCRAF